MAVKVLVHFSHLAAEQVESTSTIRQQLGTTSSQITKTTPVAQIQLCFTGVGGVVWLRRARFLRKCKAPFHHLSRIRRGENVSLGGTWTSRYQMLSLYARLPPPTPASSPHSPPRAPPCAKYTSDVRLFYFYWMRALCNAFTSVPASC